MITNASCLELLERICLVLDVDHTRIEYVWEACRPVCALGADAIWLVLAVAFSLADEAGETLDS